MDTLTLSDSGKYSARKSKRRGSSDSMSKRKFRPRATGSGHSIFLLFYYFPLWVFFIFSPLLLDDFYKLMNTKNEQYSNSSRNINKNFNLKSQDFLFFFFQTFLNLHDLILQLTRENINYTWNYN